MMMAKLTRSLLTAWAAAALLLLGGALTFAATTPPAAAASGSSTQRPRVLVRTNLGNFVIELFPQRAPLTVKAFLAYVHDGQYTNTLFHRVIANFVIQGGGHDATTYKLKPVHSDVPNESGNGLQNKRGWVGLARASGPDTGNCQFYINLVDNPELDPLPTRWGYAVFGKVIYGMNVVDRIGDVPTGSFGPFKRNAPLKPVIIHSITVIPASQSAAAAANAASPTTPASGASAPAKKPTAAQPAAKGTSTPQGSTPH